MARSRFRRNTDALPPLRITARDEALLRDVDRLGVCTVHEVRALHFPSYKTAAERCMKLFQHGYLDRLPLPATTGQPAMAHALSEMGRDHLARQGVAPRPLIPRDRPDALPLRARIARVVVSFIVGARHPGIAIPVAESLVESDGLSLVPDCAFVLDVPARLFRRVLLLDVMRPGEAVDARKTRLAAWRTWATRGPAAIEGELQSFMAHRSVSTTSYRARVSIALLAPDDEAELAAARAAVDVGCGQLLHLSTHDALDRHGALGSVWAQAAQRAAGPPAARRTSVLG